MKLRFLALCLFTALTVSSGFGQRTTLADLTKASVLRADEVRVYAILSADTAALDDLLTADCRYTHSNGRQETKAELLGALKAGALKYQRLQYTATPLIRLYNGHTAIVTGTMILEVAVATEVVKRTLATTAVYVLQNERWQLASYHSASVAP
jgi:hypothetical protein